MSTFISSYCVKCCSCVGDHNGDGVDDDKTVMMRKQNQLGDAEKDLFERIFRLIIRKMVRWGEVPN